MLRQRRPTVTLQPKPLFPPADLSLSNTKFFPQTRWHPSINTTSILPHECASLTRVGRDFFGLIQKHWRKENRQERFRLTSGPTQSKRVCHSPRWQIKQNHAHILTCERGLLTSNILLLTSKLVEAGGLEPPSKEASTKASTSVFCILSLGSSSPAGGMLGPQSVRWSSTVDGLKMSSKSAKMTPGSIHADPG